ncbi:MAG: hypothetical protein K1X88_35340 [Nannocystaceae bacterium]|nr:hypothetical protein [Nannocystaceae bacterium]
MLAAALAFAVLAAPPSDAAAIDAAALARDDAPDPPPEPAPAEPETLPQGQAARTIPTPRTDARAPEPAARPAAAKPSPAGEPWLPPRRGLSLQPSTLAVGRATFTPGKGLGLASKDGRFALNLSLRTGFQYTAKHFNDGSAPFQHAFELRRLRVVFWGNVFGEHAKYFFQLALAPRELQLRDGTLHSHPAWDVYMSFDRLRDLTLRVGMYRPQYSRERLIQDINPLLVDRSLANAEFNLDRDIGFDLRSEDFLGLGRLRYYAGVFMGEGRNAERFSDSGLLYTGRIDILPLGLFDDYDSADLARGKRFRMSLGAAYAYMDRAHNDKGVLGDRPADGGTTDMHNATADAVIKFRGLYVEGGYLWRRGKRRPGSAVNDAGVPIPTAAARNGEGWFAQLGFLLPRTYLEPTFRVSQVLGLGPGTALGDGGELGGGLNYYFAGHNLKLQGDYFRIWTDRAVARGFDQVRLQLQVAF